jgi:hypothetical protein
VTFFQRKNIFIALFASKLPNSSSIITTLGVKFKTRAQQHVPVYKHCLQPHHKRRRSQRRRLRGSVLGTLSDGGVGDTERTFLRSKKDEERSKQPIQNLSEASNQKLEKSCSGCARLNRRHASPLTNISSR